MYIYIYNEKNCTWQLCEHHCLQNLWKPSSRHSGENARGHYWSHRADVFRIGPLGQRTNAPSWSIWLICPWFKNKIMGPNKNQIIAYSKSKHLILWLDWTPFFGCPHIHHCAGGNRGFTLWSSNVAMEIHYEWSIFHGHVWLPEGTVYFNHIPLNFMKPPFIHIYHYLSG